MPVRRRAVQRGRELVARVRFVPFAGKALGFGMPLLRCQPVPSHRFHIILRDTRAGVVHHPEVALGFGIPLLRLRP